MITVLLIVLAVANLIHAIHESELLHIKSGPMKTVAIAGFLLAMIGYLGEAAAPFLKGWTLNPGIIGSIGNQPQFLPYVP